MQKTILEIVRGRTARWQVAVLDDNGAAVDLTGSTAYFTVRKTLSSNADDTDATFQLSTVSGIFLTNPTAGVLDVLVVPTQTRSLAPSLYLWDLTIMTASGYTITPAFGTLNIKPEVTRRAT